MSLTAALGDILKLNLTVQMEIRHWKQDKWEAIPSKKSSTRRMPEVLG